MNIKNAVVRELSSFKDSNLGLSSEQMGLSPSIKIAEQRIELELTGGFPTRYLEQNFIPALTEEIKKTTPNSALNIHCNFFVQAHRTQLLGKGLRGVKNLIAIASGKGGVGKSTVAVNLAIALALAGAKVGILDADIYGPSIPLMLGSKDSVKLSGEHYLPIQAHGIQAMSIGYLTNLTEALIWRGPMLAKALIQMINLTLWDELDYLFVDLPPGTGDIQLSLVQKIPLAGALVITTPQQVATLDAQKAIKMFQRTNIPVLGLIENMSLHLCSQCGHQEAIFGQGGGETLSQAINIPLLAKLPLDQKIQQHCDEGNPSASHPKDELATLFMKAALTMAIALAKQPLNYADKFPPISVE